MKATATFTMPHYYAGDLHQACRDINAIVARDEDGFDVVANADAGQIVFSGDCEPDELTELEEWCSDLIFNVTDEGAV